MCWFSCNRCSCDKYEPITNQEIYFDDNRDKVEAYLKEKMKDVDGDYSIVDDFGLFHLSKRQGMFEISGSVLPFFILVNKKTKEIKLVASLECFDDKKG